eukprot:CAMPEP_0118657610 /NCGR_PEP_ID=MMETSP0785-20121206/14113_1 /TAXON_ID=91992 /ORGANISM="Bolidomonas pacifica, Strain CCMP 1866" /LENGTH=70 /DNA_ID=CAMNT_0006550545 /DNA_START=925 /DNA_END=1134 /DNA_ORIENTATION=-
MLWVFIGRLHIKDAMGEEQEGLGSMKVRRPFPWYAPNPHPSACLSVAPPLHLNPLNEKLKSVGRAAFMPN